jgi:iron(III) transport system substrate-binding protein
VRARTIVYNTKQVNPKDLSTYANLALPQWEGRLCLRTSKKIYTKSLVASLIYHHGESKAGDIVSGWVNNLAATPNAKDSHVMNAILSGQCDVGLVNTYYYGRLVEKKPNLPLKLFWANQNTTGVHVNISGAGVTKYAKNPKAATRLLEWLSSTKAQAIYGALNQEYPAIKLGNKFSEKCTHNSCSGKTQEKATTKIGSATSNANALIQIFVFKHLFIFTI